MSQRRVLMLSLVGVGEGPMQRRFKRSGKRGRSGGERLPEGTKRGGVIAWTNPLRPDRDLTTRLQGQQVAGVLF
jgi:hypothetical protein